MIYELTMTYCLVGLRMAIHLSVLPCIIPFSSFSHFLVKDICINVIDYRYLHVFDIQVVNRKCIVSYWVNLFILRFVFYMRPYILQALQRGYSQIF